MHATASDDGGADGTTGYPNGEEHDLRSLKKMLLGAVAAMAIVAVSGSESGIRIGSGGASRAEW